MFRARSHSALFSTPNRLLSRISQLDSHLDLPDIPAPDLRQLADGLDDLRGAAEEFARTGRWPRRRRSISFGRREVLLIGLAAAGAGAYLAAALRGPAPRFSFLTEWYIPAPPDEVWKHVADPRTYPEWWGPVFLRVDVDDGAALQVGSRARYRLRGRLPYEMEFETVVTEVDAPRQLTAQSTGDLIGTGRWTIEPTLGGSIAQYEWNVSGENPPIRLLAPFARRALEWNHDWVMDQGERGLQSKLAVRH